MEESQRSARNGDFASSARRKRIRGKSADSRNRESLVDLRLTSTDETDNSMTLEDSLLEQIRRGLASALRSSRIRGDLTHTASLIVKDAIQDQGASSIDVCLDTVVEQPLRLRHIASVAYAVHFQNIEVSAKIVHNAHARLRQALHTAQWLEVKLYLRFLSCLQRLLGGLGVFELFQKFMNKAIELQTASSDDTLGLELVKIVLLNIPYAIVNSRDEAGFERATRLLDRSDILASTPHQQECLINPFATEIDLSDRAPSLLRLLQKQLAREAEIGWPIACLPKTWQSLDGFEADSEPSNLIDLADLEIEAAMQGLTNDTCPEVVLSVFTGQDLETLPPLDNIAFSLIRDVLSDTIIAMNCNRTEAGQLLMEIDTYFSPGTFAKHGTQFDALRLVSDTESTWKPEDAIVDAILCSMLQLPRARCKPVYYHSLIMEICKIAPTAIAPSLGRAIRFFYNHISDWDLEVITRFSNWFAHHLSNFGFTWKWTEWVDGLSEHASKHRRAFLTYVLSKEVRLSFDERIRGTVPTEFQSILIESVEEQAPKSRYLQKGNPFSSISEDLIGLIKRRAPDAELDTALDHIREMTDGSSEVEVAEILTVCICHLGSKSLSHLGAYIERYQDRLSSFANQSAMIATRIFSTTLDHWQSRPVVALFSIDRYLDLGIISLEVMCQVIIGSDNQVAFLTDLFTFEVICHLIDYEKQEARKNHEAAHAKVMGLVRPRLEIFTKEMSDESREPMFEAEGHVSGSWAHRWLRALDRSEML